METLSGATGSGYQVRGLTPITRSLTVIPAIERPPGFPKCHFCKSFSLSANDPFVSRIRIPRRTLIDA